MTSYNDGTSAPQVVVGLDESPQSVAALRWAATYAARTGAVLRLVHAWQLNAAEVYGPVAALREAITQDARARLSRLVTATLGSTGVPGGCRLDVVRGPVGPTLVGLAEDADLLVLGTGEHTGARRLVAGSVSHYCLSHARCPVLAVPLTARPNHHAGASQDAETLAAGPPW